MSTLKQETIDSEQCALALNSGGDLVVTAGTDKIVKFHSFPQFSLRHRLVLEDIEEIVDLSFSRDSRHVIVSEVINYI